MVFSARQHGRKAMNTSQIKPSLAASGGLKLRREMRTGIRTALIIALPMMVLNAYAQTSALGVKLTFDKPATKWTEAIPLGNGRIGAMVFGGTEDERLQINESTLWGGGPHDYTNPDAYSH